MKTCSKCKINKNLNNFYKNKCQRDGFENQCKTCAKERKAKAWKTHKKSMYERNLKWRRANPDKIAVYDRKNHLKYPHKATARVAKRKAHKLNATPKWANLEKIKLIYKKCKELHKITGLIYHVDHVVPLINKKVCGLHVWNNLQILEKSENIKKGNKF